MTLHTPGLNHAGSAAPLATTMRPAQQALEAGHTRRPLVYKFMAVVGLLGIVMAVVWFFAPSLALAGLYRYEQARAGVSLKRALLDGYTIPYYDGGRGPVIILVHGYADSKIAFLRGARRLTASYRVIIPEQMGHGPQYEDPELTVRVLEEYVDDGQSGVMALPDGAPTLPKVRLHAQGYEKPILEVADIVTLAGRADA